jgi:hypothetical protein
VTWLFACPAVWFVFVCTCALKLMPRPRQRVATASPDDTPLSAAFEFIMFFSFSLFGTLGVGPVEVC